MKLSIYCKCQHCEKYFEVEKRRKFCSRSCRNKAEYVKRALKTGSGLENPADITKI